MQILGANLKNWAIYRKYETLFTRKAECWFQEWEVSISGVKISVAGERTTLVQTELRSRWLCSRSQKFYLARVVCLRMSPEVGLRKEN
jgi:hypothetical protein